MAPPSIRLAIEKAKYVTDWHTSVLIQSALAQFIENGGYARHIRRVRAAYRERHALITSVLARDFDGELDLVPSSTGLHVTAQARRASHRQLALVQSLAAERGVAIQVLSSFAVSRISRPGFVLGYGAIAQHDIPEGLRRLKACFRD